MYWFVIVGVGLGLGGVVWGVFWYEVCGECDVVYCDYFVIYDDVVGVGWWIGDVVVKV